jgi:hypothetical protein
VAALDAELEMEKQVLGVQDFPVAAHRAHAEELRGGFKSGEWPIGNHGLTERKEIVMVDLSRGHEANAEGGRSDRPPSPSSEEGSLLGAYQTILALQRYISFPPGIAKQIGVEETIFLLNIAYAASPKDRWVCRSSAEIEHETSLTYKQQVRVRRRLADLGLLEEKSQRRDHLMHYAVVESQFDQIIENAKRQFAETTFGSNSTLPKGSSPNLPLGSSLLKKEVLQEEKTEEEDACMPINQESQNQGEEPRCSACGAIGVHACPGAPRKMNRRERKAREKYMTAEPTSSKRNPQAYEFWRELCTLFRRRTGRSLTLSRAGNEIFEGAFQTHGAEAILKAFDAWFETEKSFLRDVANPTNRFIYHIEEWISDAAQPVDAQAAESGTPYEGAKFL